MRVVIMGTPGAGKGTQAKRLAALFGGAHVSTGDILREAVSNGSALGREARRFLDQGVLVPDEVVIGIVDERLAAPDLARGFVLDGFPRTVDQAKALDATLARRGQPIDAVLHFVVPRHEVLRRLAGRHTCRRCGAIHSLSQPPATAGRCDRCGGEVVQRDDDREETVARRMAVYEEQTAPVLEYYRRTGRLREVDATGTPDEVAERLGVILQ